MVTSVSVATKGSDPAHFSSVSPYHVSGDSDAFLYLHSSFWAYGLITDRDHEGVTPETPLPYLFTFAVMLLGVVGFAYVIGNVAAAVASANEQQSAFQATVSFVSRFMDSYDVPPSVETGRFPLFGPKFGRAIAGFDLPKECSPKYQTC